MADDTRGCLFDMDGLLIDTERLAHDAFLEMAAEQGMVGAEATYAFVSFIGHHAEANELRLQSYFPGADVRALNASWGRAFEARIASGVPLKPTVFETLGALHRAGRAMAVVTSSGRAHAEHNLTITGLRPMLAGIVTADDVREKKPAPEPYEAGAALLGRAPSDCVAFEDSDTGITAAMAAGCQGWQVPDMRAAGTPFPDLGQRMADTLAEAVAGAGLL
ncbi:MAG: HAD family hydrolase [Shimia sp.]